MTLDTFFEKFDLFADAPDAVAKMRELVLHLAVTGKLVPQDPNEGDAREMIDRAMVKRQQTIKTKNLRRKNLDESADLFEHEDLPSSWCVERFANLVDPENTISYGVLVPGNDVPDGIPFVRAQDLCLSNHPARPNKTIAPEIEKPYTRTRLTGGEILLCVVGSIGKLGIVPDSWAGANIARAVARIKPIPDVLRDYLLLVLQDKSVQHYFTSTTRTLAQPTLNVGMIEQTPIPVPPLAEQKRIVAKVDELMALCDRLEAQQQEREAKASHLARASLARFADAPTPANLDYLFHSSFSIPPSDLRKSILTLAVQGKLVPQDPNDEPTLTLLGQIAAHKAALAKEGRLRGSTTVKPMADDEAEFEIPSNWCWVRFGEIMVNRDGERIPVSKEERETKAKIYDYYGASGVIDKIDGFIFDKPLLLIGEDGANLINRSTPIAFIARGRYWVNNHAHVLDGISEDFLQFVELHINAINLEKYVTGSAQPKMNQAKMNSIPLAIPPLAEQRRIVAKVEQLMALVDALETQLAASRITAANLLSALVAELTAHRPS
ncbi:MAG: restriction endonuclease subunit S [Verrucomicrobiaceae bacterium]|nr:restriction endonuclease subunit S [Verrucomicrobiaceae bacterium]